MRTIVEEWDKYRDAVYQGASLVILVEAKRSFYVGYWNALNLACNITMDPALSDTARQAILAGLLAEALDFTRQVIDLHPPGKNL